MSFVYGVADGHLAGVGSMVLYLLRLVEVNMLQKRFSRIDTIMFYVYICRNCLHPCSVKRAVRKVLFRSMYLVMGSYLMLCGIYHLYFIHMCIGIVTKNKTHTYIITLKGTTICGLHVPYTRMLMFFFWDSSPRATNVARRFFVGGKHTRGRLSSH